MRRRALLTPLLLLALLAPAEPAAADPGGFAADAPPAAPPAPAAPKGVATIGPDGRAVAPADAPPAVRAAIDAANRIVGKPYRYGGGHARFEDRGYDCSGTVSYALRAAGVLARPLDSGSLLRWGRRGRGAWITVYTNPGHAFVVIAGLRLDTSAAGDPSGAKGPRWRPALRSTEGFRARRAVGL